MGFLMKSFSEYLKKRLSNDAIEEINKKVEIEMQQIKLQEKYEILLNYVKQSYMRSCSLIDGADCLSCIAKDVLFSVGENPLKLRQDNNNIIE